MASGSNYLTTYYAKRIIGDSAAATASQALLQSGTGITDDTWIFHRTNRTSVYGIRYDYDSSSNGTKDKLELYGGYQVSSTDTPTAWVQLDTGDVYILGKVGIGYDPNTSGNDYKLYVNGSSYFTNTAYFGNGTTYYISADGSQYTGSAAKWTNARTLTIGATGKSVDGSGNVSWSMNEIMGSSDSSKFYRGDKTWSNTIVGSFNASSSGSNRANINMVSVGDVPNDFYLGNNNANKWSITSRASNESYNLNVQSTASGVSYCTKWEYSTGKFYMLHGAEVSGGKLTISANILPHIQLSRSDAGEVSIYWTNNTSGWAAGINPWGVGAGQFAIGQYSGTGSSHWRLRIDNNGYVYTSSYLNLGAGNENNASSPPRVLGFNGSDNFVRSYQTAYLNVNSATYASSYLANRGSVSGSSHAKALKAYFNSYKSSEPRNSLVAHYSSAYGNGSLCMGYFLSGYDSGPYGGFFVCHYNDPHYVGISGGTYTQQHILTSTNYTSYTVTKTGSGASGSWGISVTGSSGSCTGNAATATNADMIDNYHASSFLRYSGWWTSDNGSSLDNANGMVFAYNNHGHPGTWGVVATFDYSINSAYRLQIAGDGYNNHFWFRNRSSDRGGWYTGWKRCWEVGEAITGAVWNDYAEARISSCSEPGRTVREIGDDTLELIQERLVPCAGIISDTWGFSQGETANAKTHIAVAGRVLAYPYRDRNIYKPGDCVCAAPGGTVDIMTQDEIIMHPDRIVGIVSCVPTYDEWGGGENADRPPVKVNGRIWIKVK